MRLNAMAADRAPTIATTIHSSLNANTPPVRCFSRNASNAPVSANGSANTECSNLIISSVSRSRFQNLIFATILIHAFDRSPNLRTAGKLRQADNRGGLLYHRHYAPGRPGDQDRVRIRHRWGSPRHAVSQFDRARSRNVVWASNSRQIYVLDVSDTDSAGYDLDGPEAQRGRDRRECPALQDAGQPVSALW